MKLKKAGKNTSAVEVLNVSFNGIWLYVKDEEFFLHYDQFPWFRNATISEIHNVSLCGNHHLHWPDLDVDLELSSLKEPEQYPLQYKP